MADAQVEECPPTPNHIDQCPATPDRVVSVKSPNVNAPSPDIETSQNQPARPPAGISPPPNCVICLERFENKCFTDSCLHQFCFKCLLEWSKVKAECPLCKQEFKSIIHNVTAIDQFEEYHLEQDQPSTSEPFYFQNFESEELNRLLFRPSMLDIFLDDTGRTGGFSATLQVHPSDNDALQQLLMHQTGSTTPCPHFTQSSPTSLSQIWRRHIYDTRLYSLPILNVVGEYRDTSARYYRNNLSEFHRLLPWINRDVVSLLRTTANNTSYILNDICQLIAMFDITSPQFRRRLTTYFGIRTAHFIHELFNFARTPYDMYSYDREVRYAPNSEEVLITSGSSDEDADRFFRNPRRGRTEFTIETRSNRSTFIVTGTFDARGGTSNVATASRATATPVDVNINIVDPPASTLSPEAEDENREGQSIAVAQHTETQPQNILGTSSSIQVDQANIELSSASSDECEFVLERKAPHLRTPELVSLNSDSDSDVVFISDSLPKAMATLSDTSNTHGRKRKSATKLSILNNSEIINSDSDNLVLASYLSAEKRSLYAKSLTLKHEHNMEPPTSNNTSDAVGSSNVKLEANKHLNFPERRSIERGKYLDRKRISSTRCSTLETSETSGSDQEVLNKRSRYSSTVNSQDNMAPSTSRSAIDAVPSCSNKTKTERFYSHAQRPCGNGIKKMYESSLSSDIDDDIVTKRKHKNFHDYTYRPSGRGIKQIYERSACGSEHYSCNCDGSDTSSGSSEAPRSKILAKRIREKKTISNKIKRFRKKSKKNSNRRDDIKSSSFGCHNERLSSKTKKRKRKKLSSPLSVDNNSKRFTFHLPSSSSSD